MRVGAIVWSNAAHVERVKEIRNLRKRRPDWAGVSILVLCAAFLASLAPVAARGSLGDRLKSAALEIGTEIALDPADFLFDLHLNTQDRTPLPMGNTFQVSMPLLPSLLPLGQLGLSGKARLHREHGSWPQIDLLLGGWDHLASLFVPEVAIYGYHVGLNVAHSVDPRLRLFAGYEFTQLRVNVDLDFDDQQQVSGPVTSIGDFQDSFSTLNVGKVEHFLFAGSELLRTPVKRLVAEVGYGVVNQKLVMRLTWVSKRFDTGLSLYPEGAWVLWPFMNFQVRF